MGKSRQEENRQKNRVLRYGSFLALGGSEIITIFVRYNSSLFFYVNPATLILETLENMVNCCF